MGKKGGCVGSGGGWGVCGGEWRCGWGNVWTGREVWMGGHGVIEPWGTATHYLLVVTVLAREA